MHGRSLSILRSIVLLAFVLGAWPPSSTLAQSDAARFAEALARRISSTSLTGPMWGDLVQEFDSISFAAADVNVESFSASVIFTNPTNPGTTPWDVGFAFHQGVDTAQQIIVDSTGAWYYAPWPSGILMSGTAPFDASPGASNTLDLVVDGDTALFGVNGEFVTSIQLPPPIATDVRIGTGFYNDRIEAGRIIPFFNFEVWSLADSSDTTGAQGSETSPDTTLPSLIDILGPVLAPGDSPDAPAAEPAEPTEPTVETAPGSVDSVTPSDAETFAAVLASQEDVAPIAGPFNANLKEYAATFAASWANVVVTDFHVHAEFTVPTTAAGTPWDIGAIFGMTPSGDMRIAADSNGGVWFSIGVNAPEKVGSVPAIATQPGSTNTLDLLVADGRGWLGINGELVAVVSLPADAAAGDIAIAVALYTDQVLQDRITAFRDFVVRPLDARAFDASAVDEGAAPQPPNRADAEQFAALLAETIQTPPAAGPSSGRLIEATEGTVPLTPAGVAVTDFGAAARFINPEDPTQGLWDAGFQFRENTTDRTRVVIDSLGDVYAVINDTGARKIGNAIWYNRNPGARNTLQLFVVGDRALFGVNNQFVAAVELPPYQQTTDVSIGTGFFTEDFVVDRSTDYSEFTVWDIS